MTKKRLYQLAELLLILVVALIIYGTVAFFLEDEPRLRECETREGMIAGMPCPEGEGR